MPGLVSLIVGVICNGVRWYGCGVLICGSGFWVVVVQWWRGAMVVAGFCFELCFGLSRMWWWWPVVVGSSVVAVHCD